MILILSSTKDLASKNITDSILEIHPFKRFDAEPPQEAEIWLSSVDGKEVKLAIVDEHLAYCQNLPIIYGAELVIFVSRHQSGSGIPTLSAHVPGNLGENMYGGLPRRISVAPANSLRNALLELIRQKEEKELGFEVSFECTHHGPSLDIPAMFLEIGSTEKAWKDHEAAEAVAKATLETIRSTEVGSVALGVGGPHYNKKFTDICLKNEVAFGHIVSKYNVPFLDEQMLGQCVERTKEKVEMAILDWKGMKSEERSKVTNILEKIGLEVRKTSSFVYD
jgi:D-aminoacyl-tRNA deacylase